MQIPNSFLHHLKTECSISRLSDMWCKGNYIEKYADQWYNYTVHKKEGIIYV